LICTIALNVYLFTIVPFGFFPQQDTGLLSGSIRASQDISFDSMQVKLRQLSQMVLDDPAIFSVNASVGGNGPGGGSSNVGRLYAMLKPLNLRPNRVSADQVINRLRPKLTSIPGVALILQARQDIQIGGRSSDSQYQYTLSDENLNELNTWAPQLMSKMRSIPALRDVSTDQQNQGLAANLLIDRDAASRLGITASAIDAVLYDAFGQREVSTMYTALNQYYVVMEVDPKYQLSPDSLNGIFVKSSTGSMVPLSAIASFQQQRTALQVNHQGQYPAVTLSFNLAPNFALGDAVNALEKAQREMGMPSTIHPTFQGTAQAFQDSKNNMPWLILAALTAVYIVLGILYESYIHPLTILSTIPPAGVGAILALMLMGTELSIIALIGIILLIGIVKKNAIMMIDFALQAEREQGLPPVEAIYQACLLRFRPIMMTTMAALFGGLPLAIGMGVGSELRKPLGITIVGGLIVSQMLTLFTTPVVYLAFDRLQWHVMKLRRIGSELEEAPGD
jgi:multidrug efflux pump